MREGAGRKRGREGGGEEEEEEEEMEEEVEEEVESVAENVCIVAATLCIYSIELNMNVHHTYNAMYTYVSTPIDIKPPIHDATSSMQLVTCNMLHVTFPCNISSTRGRQVDCAHVLL